MEALSREPGDIRCNNAMGLLLMRRGQFAKAEPFFRKPIETQTERNPNPYDGEPHYNLGWCLKMQGQNDDAYAAFFKATWNAAWQDSGYFALAQIDADRGLWIDALDRIDRSLIRNWHNHKARQLKTSILRKLGRKEEALNLIEESLKIDKFNMGCRFEQYLLTNDTKDLNELKALMRGATHPYIEYALDFANAGMYEEAGQFLSYSITDEKNVYPMVYYMSGYFASQSGNPVKAREYYIKASQMPPEKCFPNRIEEVNILQDAMKVNPSDSLAPYYLGNFWYAARQYNEATVCWEKSKELNNKYPTVLRNLALAYYNKYNKKQEAKELLEQAFALDPTDSRLLMELDQLYKKRGFSHAGRLALLEKYPQLTAQRDDLCIERITLYNQLGKHKEAMELIDARKFHPWEGGEGKITGQYILCRIELAKQAIANKQYGEALRLLHETDTYPHNLGEGKLANAEENDIDYYKGIAYRGLGDEQKALSFLQKATVGSSEPQQAFFYNDQQPDKIYYQGLAWEALGNMDKAHSRYNKLVVHGEKHLFDNCRIDYFAVSLPDLAIWEDDLDTRNQIHCYYVMGLGHLGLGHLKKAKEYLEKVKELDINHLDSQLILNNIEK